MRYLVITLWLALAGLTPAAAQVSFGFSSGGVSIGINVPTYPRLVRVPGYPVYYAPGLPANYFFYDGLYWVFQDGDWYASEWYNGPWEAVPPDSVPLYVLRVPVRYYRHPPGFFRGWALNGPPRWNEHWGRDWAEHHRDWNRWDRSRMPAPAPLPSYQRRYSGDRYPGRDEQVRERERNYRYQPRDNVVREHAQRWEREAPQGREPRAETGRRYNEQSREQAQRRGEPPPRPVSPREINQSGAPRRGEAVSGPFNKKEQEDRDRRRGSGPADTGGG
jgi:hypothetical protein